MKKMFSNVQINKRKIYSREELFTLSKTELIERIVQLEAHNKQLKNVLAKKMHAIGESEAVIEDEKDNKTSANSVKKKTKRKFDFNKAHKRHVLLKFLYFGWNYHGFACQEDSNNTIEDYIFNALTRTCLIENRKAANYHRCGRTDKEVSASCQVISIDIRSNFSIDQQFNSDALINEIDYCTLLNRVLPKNIQCIAWLPLKQQQYSARFDCLRRTYRYYFPRGNLNITAMQHGCKLLKARNADFRNFCKMDVHNGVTNYIRHIYTAGIHRVNSGSCPIENYNDTGYTMYYLEISANAFLWHQIRSIMAILLLIGQEKEQPQIINELLDIEKNPCKPQYKPAEAFPLNLFSCEFRTVDSIESNPSKEMQDNIEKSTQNAINKTNNESKRQVVNAEEGFWHYKEQNLLSIIENLQNEWCKYNVKSTMIRAVLSNLEELLSENFKPCNITKQASLLGDHNINSKCYQQLLNRKRCESLENRVEHFLKKQRLIVQHGNDL